MLQSNAGQVVKLFFVYTQLIGNLREILRKLTLRKIIAKLPVLRGGKLAWGLDLIPGLPF